MSKINLLTIHYGRCYGAVMQTYATCKLLEEAGHDVSVINLIHPREKSFLWSRRNLNAIFTEFFFWLFKKRYFPKLTSKMYCLIPSHLPNADITIVGSDQVWNRDIVKEFGLSFFLDFVPPTQQRYSLSSSFGKSSWAEDDQYTELVKQELTCFNKISVREDTGVQILHDVFSIEAIRLLDPTLGYGKFDQFVLYNRPVNIIFPFLLLGSQDELKICEGISELLHLELFVKKRYHAYFCQGPRMWLTNIHNSRYIITDSFHGLALSLVFRKDFFVLIADPQKFTRLESLLRLVHLEDRIITSLSDLNDRRKELLSPIDYIKVMPILEKEQEKYRKFVNSI